MNLKGSNVGPMLRSPIDRMALRKAQQTPATEALLAQLQEAQAFLRTPHGQACARVASAQIARLTGLLLAPSHALAMKLGTTDSGIIAEYRAEIRGQIAVWDEIQSMPQNIKILKEQLDELEQGEEIKKS